MSGTFDLYDIMYKRCLRTAFKPLSNGMKNGDIDGTRVNETLVKKFFIMTENVFKLQGSVYIDAKVTWLPDEIKQNPI